MATRLICWARHTAIKASLCSCPAKATLYGPKMPFGLRCRRMGWWSNPRARVCGKANPAVPCARRSYMPARHTFAAPVRCLTSCCFYAPQYNTWIELMYDQNQADILKYARGIRENGFPAGVLMVDDNWQQNYGQWDFKQNKFPDAKAMIASLHADGFKVMLWICPFVHTNSEAYPRLAGQNLAIKGQVGCRRLDKMVERAKRVARFYEPRRCGLVLFTTGLS